MLINVWYYLKSQFIYFFIRYAICCPCHSIKVLKFSDETLSKVRRFLICKISTLSVSDFMKPVKSNPSQAAEQWYDMAIVTHNQIFMKCYIFKSHHLMLEESEFTRKRWFPLSHQVTAQQHRAQVRTKLGTKAKNIYLQRFSNLQLKFYLVLLAQITRGEGALLERKLYFLIE